MSISVVKCREVLQCSDGLSNKVSNIIRRHIDNRELLLICFFWYYHILSYYLGPGVAQWLRHSATSRAVPGLNPGGVGHRDFSRGYRQNHVPWG